MITLTDTQTAIIRGLVCPYCKGNTEFVDSAEVYGRSFGMIYLCRACRAYCGVHKGTDKALGRVADAELRKLKKEAHLYFDMIWKDGHMKRAETYAALGEYLGIQKEYCHIGMFSPKTCRAVVEWSKRTLNDMRRLDLDFGVEPKRPHFEIQTTMKL